MQSRWQMSRLNKDSRPLLFFHSGSICGKIKSSKRRKVLSGGLFTAF